MKNIAFVFPGQGAQFPGMGKVFYDTFAERANVQNLEDLESLKKILL